MVGKLLIVILSLFLVTNDFREYKQEIVIPEYLTAEAPTIEYVYKCAVFYGLQYPEIVVAQSILETGYYKSYGCTRDKNLFGLYDSKNRRFFKFDTWQESVKAYKTKVQYKYKSGDYYSFLEQIGYAEDSTYVEKVKLICAKIYKQQKN